MDIFEIDGVKYTRKTQSPKRFGKSYSLMMQMALMMGGMSAPVYGAKKEKKMTDVDIIEEYKLIQQKKSSLSRKDREWVVQVFKENFIIVSE